MFLKKCSILERRKGRASLLLFLRVDNVLNVLNYKVNGNWKTSKKQKEKQKNKNKHILLLSKIEAEGAIKNLFKVIY